MRIRLIHPTGKEANRDYDSFLKDYYPKVVRPDTEVDIQYTEGPLSGFNEYFVLLKKQEVIEKLLEAEKEGYDAVMVNCATDLAVQEARSILNIPVIGPSEASMHLACQLGGRFGIITIPAPICESNRIIDFLIKPCGLESRAIPNPVRIFSLSQEEQHHDILKDPKILEPDLLSKAEDLVQCGAEVVLILCCNVGPVATMANLVKVGEKDIPILDCVAVGLKTAEMMVDLKNLGIPIPSRARSYALPFEEDLKRVKAVKELV